VPSSSTTTGSSTTTTVAGSSTTTTTGALATSAADPTGGQVPESPYVPLLPFGAATVAGGLLIVVRARRGKPSRP
jgi:hypothetical protein